MQIGVVKAIFARMGEPKTIDHDPEEPPLDRTGNGIYWAAFGVLLILWIGNLILIPLNWNSVFLGFGTGLLIGIWSIAITGNRVPKWMRR